MKSDNRHIVCIYLIIVIICVFRKVHTNKQWHLAFLMPLIMVLCALVHELWYFTFVIIFLMCTIQNVRRKINFKKSPFPSNCSVRNMQMYENKISLVKTQTSHHQFIVINLINYHTSATYLQSTASCTLRSENSHEIRLDINLISARGCWLQLLTLILIFFFTG